MIKVECLGYAGHVICDMDAFLLTSSSGEKQVVRQAEDGSITLPCLCEYRLWLTGKEDDERSSCETSCTVYNSLRNRGFTLGDWKVRTKDMFDADGEIGKFIRWINNTPHGIPGVIRPKLSDLQVTQSQGRRKTPSPSTGV